MAMSPEAQYEHYIEAALAFVNNELLKNGREPDERLMRGIEERMDIPEQGADDFRRSFICWLANFKQHHNSTPRYQDFPDQKFEAAIIEYTRHG